MVDGVRRGLDRFRGEAINPRTRARYAFPHLLEQDTATRYYVENATGIRLSSNFISRIAQNVHIPKKHERIANIPPALRKAIPLPHNEQKEENANS